MNTDIEDFIMYKNKAGLNDYNNFDPSRWDVGKCKNIFTNLLSWLQTFDDENGIGNNNKTVLSAKFENELSKQMRVSRIQGLRKSVLINVLNNLVSVEDFGFDLRKHFDLLKLLMRKKPMRNMSGITSITVITAPFPDGQKFSCKHNCYYCPNEPAHKDNGWQAQPRSYLFSEPAVLRANQHKFLAIGQMLNRMDTYFSNGHVIDKLEIIVEGGTFTEYPVDYLERYHRDIFYAANIYFDLRKAYPNYDNCGSVVGEGIVGNGDGAIGPLDLMWLEKIRQPLSIAEEIKINKTAKVHIIGICIETRPDALNDQWLKRFRDWGVTRVQLGAQHVDNAILKKINRGHTVEQLLWAMQYLKDNCFKIDIHIMPDLPGSSPDIDKEMFDYVYSVVCPDQMKVYPCEVVPWTVIQKWYRNGTYVPYFEKNSEDLVDVVRYSMVTCPKWVRLPRVIRDIPSSYIECGNTIANLRQVIDQKLDAEGVVSMDIRSREIGRHTKYYNLPGGYNSYSYQGNGGLDYFIAYESYDLRALFGFIRLRIVNSVDNMIIFDILRGRGLVRELHVYGETLGVGIGVYDERGCQHKGIGGGLLRLAEKKTMEHGLKGIVVISGEGVKGYYEKNGYREVDTFMVKDFWWFEVWFWMFVSYFKQYFMGWY